MNRQHRQGWIAGIFVLASCSSPSSSAPDPGPADPGPGDLAPEPGPPPATWYHLEAVFEDGSKLVLDRDLTDKNPSTIDRKSHV